MRAVVQRVDQARLVADGMPQDEMGPGLLVLVGIQDQDDEAVMHYMVQKIATLRIFTDAEGHMNISARDLGYGLYLVPNFTLYGDCRHGRRPSFFASSRPETAEKIFEKLVETARREAGIPVHTGVFQTHMVIETTLDGPVTLLIDSDKMF